MRLPGPSLLSQRGQGFADPRRLLRACACALSQADGIVCVKTAQAVLVAEYAHPTVPGEATKIVEVRPSSPVFFPLGPAQLTSGTFLVPTCLFT